MDLISIVDIVLSLIKGQYNRVSILNPILHFIMNLSLT